MFTLSLLLYIAMRLRRGSMLLRSGSRGSKAATQRSKFKVKPKGLTRRRLFTRSSAALHAEGFTRAAGALPAAQLPYTLRSSFTRTAGALHAL
jgi:hypothetical protein